MAHGLNTSYKNFIDDFWNRKCLLFQNAYNSKNLVSTERNMYHKYKYAYEDEDITIDIEDKLYILNPDDSIDRNNGYNKLRVLLSKNSFLGKIKFNNVFLECITEKIQLQNWVDIEEEYYKALINCIDGKGAVTIDRLNSDFSSIKRAIENYLEIQAKKIDIDIRNDIIFNNIYLPMKWTDFRYPPDNINLKNIIFLSFNYTNTEKLYIDNKYNYEIIHIHGELGNSDNPIIFGYGDEISEKYKIIEELNDNNYLKNIKSFGYLKTNNYKRLLEQIDDDEYQIFVMGHSCGNSDRTLLNTLFEHKNCKSIRIFYRREEDDKDYYIDTSMNISRNFTKKDKMREIIVTKKNSVPLGKAIKNLIPS
jgi:hypothetical protein